MDLYDLFQNMKESGDSTEAVKMSAYMRNQFPFLGIHTPERRKLCQVHFREIKKYKQADWEFLFACWKEPCREFQYAAIDYLVLMQKYLTAADVPNIKALALDKSWWDTIDGLDRVVGAIAQSCPEVNATLLEWSLDENFWLRRIAIDHQISRKDKTDTVLLEKIIVNNLGQTEFFINKAIGWSLRDYSKTNPEWVRDFIARYRERLAPLSVREAAKHL